MKFYICGAPEDALVTTEFINLLEDCNHTASTNHRRDRSGAGLRESLRGIETSDALVFCISPNTIDLNWCLWELQEAVKCRKRILPLLIDKNTRIPVWFHERKILEFNEVRSLKTRALVISGLEEYLASITPKELPETVHVAMQEDIDREHQEALAEQTRLEQETTLAKAEHPVLEPPDDDEPPTANSSLGIGCNLQTFWILRLGALFLTFGACVGMASTGQA